MWNVVMHALKWRLSSKTACGLGSRRLNQVCQCLLWQRGDRWHCSNRRCPTTNSIGCIKDISTGMSIEAFQWKCITESKNFTIHLPLNCPRIKCWERKASWFVLLTKYSYDQNKENEMSETCGMHGGKKNTYQVKGQRPVDRCGHGSEFEK